MYRPVLIIASLLALAITATVAITWLSPAGVPGVGEIDEHVEIVDRQRSKADHIPRDLERDVACEAVGERLRNLELLVTDLQSRLDDVEHESAASGGIVAPLQQLESANISAVSVGESLVSRLTRVGVDAGTAERIASRQSRAALARLELQDKAIREHYVGTERYSTELNELANNDISIRHELGDERFDKFLYTSGQRNRIRVESVISGSQAEQAGIKGGDLILNYADRRLFSWNDLRRMTSGGNPGEYVDVTISRGGDIIIVPISRGPLGVQLGGS